MSLKALTGEEVPEGTKGIVYLCKYHHKNAQLDVKTAIFFTNQSDAFEAYANIPNPESQMAIETRDYSFEENLKILHNNMADLEWRKELGDYL